MEGSIYLWIGGFYNLAFLVFHDFFWVIFKWKDDLPKLTPINKAIMQVLNLMLIFTFLIFAYASLFHMSEMLTTPLGKSLTLLIAVFWLIRAILQLVYFSRVKLISYIMFIIFLLGSYLYLMAWLG